MFTSDVNGLTQRTRVGPQVLGHRGSRPVADASHVEKKLDQASGLVLFPIDGVFADPKAVFLGFGKPNTYLVLPRPHDNPKGTGWDKFAAFMFWRKASFVANTRGRVQAGALLELRGLSDETIASLRDIMQNRSGKRGASCAHSNALVLDESGFTCNGKRLTHVYRPSKLFSLLWRHGLELNGQEIELRLVQTDAEVGDHFVSVWRREFTSLCRTVKKKFQRHDDNAPAAPVFDEQIATAAIQPDYTGEEMTLVISRPSAIGVNLGFLFGQHPIFIGVNPCELEAPELAEPLKPFPGKLDRITKIKKYFLFSRPVVKLIRGQLVKDRDTQLVIPRQLVDMLRSSDGPEPEQAFKYNVVVSGRLIYLSRLENRNGRDRPRINWLLAKHVLTCGYDPDVRFSGEVWKHTDDNGVTTLYLSGDSGTYKPGPERVQPMADWVASTFNVTTVAVKPA